MTTQSTQKIDSWPPRRVMFTTLLVVAVVAGFWLLYQLGNVLLLFVVAVMLGTALKPAVLLLERRGLPRLYAEILLYLVLLLALIAFLLLALPPFLEQATELTRQIGRYYGDARSFLLRSPSEVLRSLGFRLPLVFQVEDVVQNPLPANGSAAAGTPADSAAQTADLVAETFRYTGLAAKVLFSLVAVFLMAFYWTLEGDRAIRAALLLAPNPRREDIRKIVSEIEERVGGYLLGQGILCLIVGGMQLVAYLLIGLPNAFVLALIAGVTEAIPIVGPALGAVPAVLVAITTDPAKLPWVILAAAIVQGVENSLLVPRVMGRSVGVHPLLTLLFLAAFSSLLGLIGALLAIPAAAVLQILMNHFVFNRQEEFQVETNGRDYLSMLRLRAQEIAQDTRKQLREKDQETDPVADRLEDEIEALANELDQVLNRANQAGDEPA